jgi:hypothetical protein
MATHQSEIEADPMTEQPPASTATQLTGQVPAGYVPMEQFNELVDVIKGLYAQVQSLATTRPATNQGIIDKLTSYRHVQNIVGTGLVQFTPAQMAALPKQIVLGQKSLPVLVLEEVPEYISQLALRGTVTVTVGKGYPSQWFPSS